MVHVEKRVVLVNRGEKKKLIVMGLRTWMEAAIVATSTEQHRNGNMPPDSVLGDMGGDDELGLREKGNIFQHFSDPRL